MAVIQYLHLNASTLNLNVTLHKQTFETAHLQGTLHESRVVLLKYELNTDERYEYIYYS